MVSIEAPSSMVVTTDSSQALRSSRIFSRGPTRQISSTMEVGTAAAASSLRPSRYSCWILPASAS